MYGIHKIPFYNVLKLAGPSNEPNSCKLASDCAIRNSHFPSKSKHSAADTLAATP
jgi:hypothetical protein